METVVNIIITIAAVAVGILGIKTTVEYALYGIPFAVKLPKNGVACVMDTAVMISGVLFAKYGPIERLWARYRDGVRA